MTQETDAAGNILITPDERLNIAPVTNAADSKSFGWTHVRLEDYPDLPQSDIYCPGMREHLLVFHYKALDDVFHHECAGERTRTRLETGQLSYIPAYADNRWLFGKGAPCALHIILSEELMTTVLEEECDIWQNGALGGDFQITSPGLEDAASKLWHELYNGGAGGELYSETLGTVLVTQLGFLFKSRKPTPHGYHGEKSIAVARDLIHTDYHRSPSLQELAQQAGLSRAQLVRNFRKYYGKSPHQYLIEYRVDLAKTRLRSELGTSLAEISSDLGFTDQSHFHRHFLAKTGATPGQYRAQFGSQ